MIFLPPPVLGYSLPFSAFSLPFSAELGPVFDFFSEKKWKMMHAGLTQWKPQKSPFSGKDPQIWPPSLQSSATWPQLRWEDGVPWPFALNWRFRTSLPVGLMGKEMKSTFTFKYRCPNWSQICTYFEFDIQKFHHIAWFWKFVGPANLRSKGKGCKCSDWSGHPAHGQGRQWCFFWGPQNVTVIFEYFGTPYWIQRITKICQAPQVIFKGKGECTIS